MSLNPEDLARAVRSAREAAHVERCHTKPHHGSYSTGAHSYGMLAMALILHPAPSLALLREIAFHDAGERWVGDIPWMAKQAHPELRKAYEAAEEAELERHNIPGGVLSLEDREWLAALDLLEFYMWALDQLAFGFSIWEADVRRCEKVLRGMIEAGRLPAPLRDLAKHYNPEWTDD